MTAQEAWAMAIGTPLGIFAFLTGLAILANGLPDIHIHRHYNKKKS